MSSCSFARSRLRRFGVAAVLSAGLIATGTTVVSAAPVPAPAAPVAPGSVVGLRYGDRGTEVRSLQQALIRVGVGVNGGVDGIFGSGTRASARRRWPRSSRSSGARVWRPPARSIRPPRRRSDSAR